MGVPYSVSNPPERPHTGVPHPMERTSEMFLEFEACEAFGVLPHVFYNLPDIEQYAMLQYVHMKKLRQAYANTPKKDRFFFFFR